MVINRQIETDKIIIYRRQRGNETNIPLYFAYDKEKQQSTGDEFRTITQARKYILIRKEA